MTYAPHVIVLLPPKCTVYAIKKGNITSRLLNIIAFKMAKKSTYK